MQQEERMRIAKEIQHEIGLICQAYDLPCILVTFLDADLMPALISNANDKMINNMKELSSLLSVHHFLASVRVVIEKHIDDKHQKS